MLSVERSRPVSEFIASRDVVDSLRLEISTVQPRLQEGLGIIARKVAAIMVDKYGQFMPKAKRKVADGIEHRLLLLEKDSFQTFYDAWIPREEQDYPIAAVFRKGLITVLRDPYEAWNDIPEDERARFVEFFGSEHEAKKEVMFGNLVSNIAHETVHQFQDWTNPELFFELGTRFYKQEVMREIGYGYGMDKFEERRVNFYKELTEKRWGDDVHKLFFGSLRRPYPRDVVLGLVGADFSPRKYELFPLGYGTTR